jgi:predicted transposase YbfD/YdcC
MRRSFDKAAEQSNMNIVTAFVHVVSKRTTGEKTSHSERFYLFSKKHTTQAAATLIRGRWQIENRLHWSRDVVMNDDKHRARKDNACCASKFCDAKAHRFEHHQSEPG